MGRLIAERKLAAIARRRARAAVGETASRLKDEVAKQVAQIDDDRAYAVPHTLRLVRRPYTFVKTALPPCVMVTVNGTSNL